MKNKIIYFNKELNSILIIIILFSFLICFGFSYLGSTQYYPNHTVMDQGNTTGRSVKNMVDAIGASKNATITLKHSSNSNETPYLFETNETVPSNITFEIESGAYIDGNATLTIEGPFKADLTKCFGSSITVVFGEDSVKEIYPQWRGADGQDPNSDDTDALQWSFNTAASSKGMPIYIPGGYYKFSKLYLYYDANNNSGWPSSNYNAGRINITGAGALTKANFANADYSRTLLHSIDSTGPAIEIDGNSNNYMLQRLSIRDLSIMASNTTQVLKMYYVNNFVGLRDVSIYQAGAGDGILAESIWTTSWENVFVIGVDPNTSDVGITIRNVSGETGGGNILLKNVTARDFDKGWEVGHNTYNSGATLSTVNTFNCQASTCSTYGVLIGHGTKSINWFGGYIENCQDGSNGGIGLILRNGTQTACVKGAYFTDNDIGLQVGVNGGGTNGAVYGATIENCFFVNILVEGIRKYVGANTKNITISDCYFAESGSAPGNTYGIWLEDSPHRGLIIGQNIFASGFTTNIENSDRTEIFISHNSNNQAFLVKIGNLQTFTDGDATPDVSIGNFFKTSNTSPTTYTNFDSGIEGQKIRVLFDDPNSDSTIDFTGTNLKGNVGADWSPADGDWMECLYDGTDWYCSVHDCTS